ncbi:MAG: UDP-N-acetylglucosamine 4,6-dehydratase (inverting) [Peptococcaceae bacterium]|nr:UDP-N-acetylglucosamine 4,6-dehydratase (inverting) [Peptococcaceae bacterium]
MDKNYSVLITGGTGSFGRHMVEKLLMEGQAGRIIVYSRDEFKQDLMNKELRVGFGDDMIQERVRFFVGDVRDKDRLMRAFKGVKYVFHAAALKQVPTCEYNPFEAIKTNIHGAQNVIDAAIDCGVKKVIALSTDKAVSPINLYGGTKLVSDKLFTAANAYSGKGGTIFSVVRYGNVAGSRGSVIPFFRQLLEQGERVLPITDVGMTRFWMTLDAATDLVALALEKAKGGEVFVFKNPSFKITDLAKVMNPGGDIKVIGIREGEKLHECMITADDARVTYEYQDYYIIYPKYNWWNNEMYFTNGGKPVEDGWEYNSATNSVWFGEKELSRQISLVENNNYPNNGRQYNSLSLAR